MKYFKHTFLWIIILAAVAGYSLIDFKRTEIEEIKKDEATRLLPFMPKDVMAITLEKEERVIELERWEDGWRIVKPIDAKAKSETVEKFLTYVTESRNDADYVMDPDPTPARLTEFGLLNPRLLATLKVGKELTPYTLIFGARAPTKGVSFAQLKGQKPVYRVLADAHAQANQDLYYFRDKSILRLEPVMINQLVIVRPDIKIRLNLPDSAAKWELEKPVKARADHNRVFELLGAFKNAEIKEFIAETQDNLSSYGLDKPDIKLLFWLAGDTEPTVTLSIGKRSPQKRGYFSLMTDRNYIFLLEEETVNAIPNHENDLRSRELLFFDKDKLKRIEIRQPDQTIVLVKDMERDWRLNNLNSEKVDFNLVRELLDELINAEIKDFLTEEATSDLGKFGLEPASVQVLIWPEDRAVPISLSIGEKTPSGYVYAQSGSENIILAIEARIKNFLLTHFNI
tara:strand:+ start:3578 stop:4942 length:1365 start_codon:yes stop_codon:yes gene_type:complete